jgi:GGDEF domain-containing protein
VQALLLRSVDAVVAPYRQLRRDRRAGARLRPHAHQHGGPAQAEIRTLAYRDRLTGLPNRLQFRDAVVRAIAAQADPARDHIAVLMLDLDRFKHVNDVLGYASGDRLLQAVAERLSAGGARRRRPGGAPGRRRVRGAAAGRRDRLRA